MSQKLILPIDNSVVNAGYKKEKYAKQFGFSHFGMDLGEKSGYKPVHACGTGTVVAAGMDGSTLKGTTSRLGNVIVIIYKDVLLQNGKVSDLTCRMFHFDETKCKAGEQVTTDTVIGLYGNTGFNSTGPHLHIEFDTDTKWPCLAYGVSSGGKIINRQEDIKKAGGTADSTLNPSVVWFLGDGQSAYTPQNWIDEGWTSATDINLPKASTQAEVKIKIPGIDVSEHQGKIDWGKVAGDAEFAFIRTGWSWYDGGHDMDDRFLENIAGSIEAGIPTGVYTFAYDRTPESARIAAQMVLSIIKSHKLRYPVVYDFEDPQYQKYSKEKNTDIAIAFLEEIQKAGYFAMVYASTNFFINHLNMDRLSQYAIWVADYREPTGTVCPYKGTFGIWQYKGGKGDGDGRCAGISGYCDRNYAYEDFVDTIKKAGLNHLNEAAEPENPVQETVSKAEYDALNARYEELWKRYDAEIEGLKSAVADAQKLAESLKILYKNAR